jgi:S1-C subfamily serine protease
VYSVLLASALLGQFAENKGFPKPLQQEAFDATAGTYHPASRSRGTAILVAYRDGTAYFLTAAHLVPTTWEKGREKEDVRKVELQFYSSKEPKKIPRDVDAFVLERMPNEDLAVLTAQLKDAPKSIPVCPRERRVLAALKPPFDVMTLGMIPDGPPEIRFDVVKGKELVTKPDGSKAFFWEANRPQELGRSGGPMIDTSGHVIGIASGIQHGKGYYAHIDEIHRALSPEFVWLYENAKASGK